MNKPNLWPNFLIIGAGKAGTTSLYHYLKNHPEVFMPEVKEPQFFSGTLPEYTSEDAYLNLFREKSDAKMWGESSVSYFNHPGACQKIYDHLGSNVKLICLLRNPVRTIYSRWGQLVKMNLETRPAEEAILNSFTLSGFDMQTNTDRYAWAVDYATHIHRYLQVFPKSHLKILIFEEFFQPGLPLYRELCRFLEVSESHSPENFVHNQGQIWKTTFVNTPTWEKTKSILAPIIRKIIPKELRADLYKKFETWNKMSLPPMSGELEAVLINKLEDGKKKLEDLLGRDLSKLWF